MAFNQFPGQPNPIENHINVMSELEGIAAAPFAAQLFGNAGREHMRLYGTTKEHLIKIAYKNHLHSTNNPFVYVLQSNPSSSCRHC